MTQINIQEQSRNYVALLESIQGIFILTKGED